MANVVTPLLDPALLTQQAVSGTAQILSNPQAAFWATLFSGVNSYGGGVEVLDTTAASLSLIVGRSDIKISGTMAFTLPNGTYEGQTKTVNVITAASTPAMTLTITTPDATTGFVCPATIFFDTVGQSVTFRWMTTAGTAAWRVVNVVRAGGTANNVTVGTTVLNINPLWSSWYLSVTGTVSSTTTKAIPNGLCPGDSFLIKCSTASTIPSGTIGLTALTALGAASTTLGTFNATTCMCALRWNGAAYEGSAFVTVTLS